RLDRAGVLPLWAKAARCGAAGLWFGPDDLSVLRLQQHFTGRDRRCAHVDSLLLEAITAERGDGGDDNGARHGYRLTVKIALRFTLHVHTTVFLCHRCDRMFFGIVVRKTSD